MSRSSFAISKTLESYSDFLFEVLVVTIFKSISWIFKYNDRTDRSLKLLRSFYYFDPQQLLLLSLPRSQTLFLSSLMEQIIFCQKHNLFSELIHNYQFSTIFPDMVLIFSICLAHQFPFPCLKNFLYLYIYFASNQVAIFFVALIFQTVFNFHTIFQVYRINKSNSQSYFRKCF